MIVLNEKVSFSSKEDQDPLEAHKNWLTLNCTERWEDISLLLKFFIAGEENISLLLYVLLAGSYHKSYKNMCLIRGDSSGGKNHVVEHVLQLFPKSDVYTYSDATPAALKYDEDMKNKKILYLREMKPMLGMVETLKSRFDGDAIEKETIRVQEDGESRNKTITHMHEQMGVVTTFSFENTQIDLVNRSWVLTPDQTYEQTERITAHSLELERDLIKNAIKTDIMKRKCLFVANTLQLLDWDVQVQIPYVDILEPLFPKQFLNVRRDLGKFIKLIKIISILNQNDRKYVIANKKKWILAGFFDLKLALKISAEIFWDQVLHLDKVKRAVLDFLPFPEDILEHNSDPNLEEKEEAGKKVTEVFEEVRDRLGVSRKTVSRKMNDLFYEGYLVREKKGSAYVFTKLRHYDIESTLNLESKREEIEHMTDMAYEIYKDGIIAD